MNSSQENCLLNGEPGSMLSVMDRGLNYGHGLFETARLVNGAIPLWHRHIARLIRGAKNLKISVDQQIIESYLQQLLKTCPSNGLVKIVVTAGVSGRGYYCTPDAVPNYLLCWHPTLDYGSDYQCQGASLKLCHHRLPQSPTLAGVKHLSRIDQVIARMEWRENYAEGLMLDQQDFVVEGVSSNLFFFKGNQCFTPALDQCGVAGVMRQLIMDELLPQCGFNLIETKINLNELLLTDELFVCNSVIGIWPVISLYGDSNSRLLVKEQKLAPDEVALGQWPLGRCTGQLQQALYSLYPHYQSVS